MILCGSAPNRLKVKGVRHSLISMKKQLYLCWIPHFWCKERQKAKYAVFAGPCHPVIRTMRFGCHCVCKEGCKVERSRRSFGTPHNSSTASDFRLWKHSLNTERKSSKLKPDLFLRGVPPVPLQCFPKLKMWYIVPAGLVGMNGTIDSDRGRIWGPCTNYLPTSYYFI